MVSKSSQLLFLSQIDDTFNHSSSASTPSSKPSVQVQGSTTHRTDIRAEKEVHSKGSSLFPPSQEVAVSPSQEVAVSPSQGVAVSPSQGVAVIPQEQSPSQGALQGVPRGVPHEVLQTTHQETLQKALTPKKRRRVQEKEEILEEMDYNHLLKRLENKALTMDGLLNTYCSLSAPQSLLAIREMRFILLQNLVTVSGSHNKRYYAQLVFDCLKKTHPPPSQPFVQPQPTQPSVQFPVHFYLLLDV